jgi:hypothetical protein
MDRIGSGLRAGDGDSLFGERSPVRLSILFILSIPSKIIRSVGSNCLLTAKTTRRCSHVSSATSFYLKTNFTELIS